MYKKDFVFSKVGLYAVFASLLLVSLIIQSCSTPAPQVVEADVTSTTAPQTSADQMLPATKGTKVPANQFLEKAFQKQKQVVENIGKQIEKSADLREKAQERITELKNEGKQVPVLENMLKRYDATIAEIKTRYQKIQENVSVHKGFDDAGKVIDAKLGRETVRGLTAEVRKIQIDFQKVRRIITLEIMRYRQFEKTPMPS
jgi:DNA repair exonuclease SbcCD ATPase subunit